MHKTILLLILLVLTFHNGKAQNKSLNAEHLIEQMTLEEKIDFVSGYQNFYIHGLERLDIPDVLMADGPMGVKGHGKATAFPASICMAATWNPELIEEMAGAIAKEARSKNIKVLLAPGVNMYRIPHCGRNFEYYGEDPFLASRTAVAFINGVQDNGVMATVKHFVANNHDYDRHRVSSNIDKRTLHEIYFPVFKAAVQEANVGVVMTSYNLLNGVHTSESSWLMKDILRDQWGFKGIIMSDWISVYSFNAFEAGLDLEMPRAMFLTKENISKAMDDNPDNEGILDEKVQRILQTCINHNLYSNDSAMAVDWEAHNTLAQKVAEEGIVLLRNKNQTLPFKKSEARIAVIGPNAMYTPHSGGGAAMVDAYRMTSFYEGIKNQAPAGVTVDYISVEGIFHPATAINLKKLHKQLKTIAQYDEVVICLGFNSESEGEGFDRPFQLPGNQQHLLEEVLKLHKDAVVVLNSGGGVFLPEEELVHTLLYTWFPGQAGGTALANILFGTVNPSGKLPISIEKQWSDNAAFNSYDTSFAIEGAKPFYTLYGKPHDTFHMNYPEGIFMGYRHFDKHHIEPLFPFGFGLSYSDFEMSEFEITDHILHAGDTLRLKVKVKNTGNYDGAETIQIYVGKEDPGDHDAEKALKAFKKIQLGTGDNQEVNFHITQSWFEGYNDDCECMMPEENSYRIYVGNSSRSISLETRIIFSR